MNDVDVGPAILAALQTNPAITDLLSIWTGEPAIFNRRPPPDDAEYPLAMISPDITIGDQDFLKTRIPVVRRDITIFGEQPDQYRAVETAARKIRTQFHRVRSSLVVEGFSIVDIVVSGPRAAPADDQKLVARACLLTIKLRDLST